MRAYKAFNKDLACTMGHGIFQYEVGKTYEEEEAKCVRSGFHAAENPLDCFSYYSPRPDTRYCLVECEGDINEDGSDTKIACTRMRIIKELTLFQMVVAGIAYAVNHPQRDWKDSPYMKKGSKGAVKADKPVLICYGSDPKAYGTEEGQVLGFIRMHNGNIEDVAVGEVGKGLKPGAVYHVADGGEGSPVEV